jgi:hypothetical protein
MTAILGKREAADNLVQSSATNIERERPNACVVIVQHSLLVLVDTYR